VSELFVEEPQPAIRPAAIAEQMARYRDDMTSRL
jgi:hypothetical protein